jgi:hypothetical protein
MRAFEVTGLRSRRTRLEVTAERGPAPLVDRDRELAILKDLFREVRQGRARVGLGLAQCILRLFASQRAGDRLYRAGARDRTRT